jgi:hypothetical protein
VNIEERNLNIAIPELIFGMQERFVDSEKYAIYPKPVVITIDKPCERIFCNVDGFDNPFSKLQFSFRMLCKHDLGRIIEQFRNCDQVTAEIDHFGIIAQRDEDGLSIAVTDTQEFNDKRFIFFTMVQEILAVELEQPVGKFYYTAPRILMNKKYFLRLEPIIELDVYRANMVLPYPIIRRPGDYDVFLNDLSMLVSERSIVGMKNVFLRKIGHYLTAAYDQLSTTQNYDMALEVVGNLPEYNDWRYICSQWLQTQKERHETAQQNQSTS